MRRVRDESLAETLETVLSVHQLTVLIDLGCSLPLGCSNLPVRFMKYKSV